jgi:hypothetical protein
MQYDPWTGRRSEYGTSSLVNSLANVRSSPRNRQSGDSVSYGNPFPYYTSKKHKDMQRLRPTANGITPGPLPPGIIAKKVEKTDIWLIVEDLDVVDKNKDLVQTTEGWSYDTKEAAAVRHELGRKFVYLEPQKEPVQCPGGLKG